MPTTTNLAANDRHLSQQDTGQFNKYDVYFTLHLNKEIPAREVWNKLTGSEKWTQNMGPTMRAITPERSPVTEQEPAPELITTQSKRNVYAQKERTEDGKIYKHRFESEQIPFVGEFQDVRRDQVDPLLKDITNQIVVYSDHHTRHRALQRAQYIWVCGYTGGATQLVEVPNTKTTADSVPKTTDFWEDLVNKCAGKLTLEELDKARISLQQDLGASPFSGPKNGVVLKNDLMQGSFQAVIGAEAWANFRWSENADFLKSLDTDFLFQSFKGRLFGDLDCQNERYPLRIAADGTRPAPEIHDNNGYTIPNPDYINARWELGYVCGDDFGASIEVGPPSKTFAKGVTGEQGALKWNGKPFITKNLLIKYADGSLDTNDYGEIAQIRGQVAVGYVPKRALSMIPILYLRARVSRDN